VAKHRGAVAQVLTWISIVVIWSVAGVLVPERLGVPVSSLIASAAVLGAALGFGAQQVVRDLLAGLFIVVERQYGHGDLVHIPAVGFEGATGTIEEVALRTTRLRSSTGDVVTISNGLIVGVTTCPATGPGPTTCSARSARTRSRTTPCGPCCWTPRP
jgi:small conductance mechanosensitive channel